MPKYISKCNIKVKASPALGLLRQGGCLEKDCPLHGENGSAVLGGGGGVVLLRTEMRH